MFFFSIVRSFVRSLFITNKLRGGLFVTIFPLFSTFVYRVLTVICVYFIIIYDLFLQFDLFYSVPMFNSFMRLTIQRLDGRAFFFWSGSWPVYLVHNSINSKNFIKSQIQCTEQTTTNSEYLISELCFLHNAQMHDDSGFVSEHSFTVFVVRPCADN